MKKNVNLAEQAQPPSPRPAKIRPKASTLMIGDLPMLLPEEETLVVTRVFDAIRLDTTSANGHYSFMSRRRAFAYSNGKEWKGLEVIVNDKISDFVHSYAPGMRLKIEVHFSRKSTESFLLPSRQRLLYSLQNLLHTINLQSNLYDMIKFELIDDDLDKLPVRYIRG